jgi:predicted RecA/RadA family phage recombinase
MSRAYVQDGDTLEFVTAGAVVNGEVIEFAGGIGIALAAATGAGQTIAVAMTGVWDLAKVGATAWAQGAKLYWDTTNNRLTNIAAGSTPCGIAWKAALSADPTAWVKIDSGVQV